MVAFTLCFKKVDPQVIDEVRAAAETLALRHILIVPKALVVNAAALQLAVQLSVIQLSDGRANFKP